jgi:tRNA wybutosine-synthesizing protein 4
MPLMVKKRDVVMKTNELRDALTNLFLPEAGPVLLCSDQYLQVGCDLCDLSKLTESLASVVELKECVVLCTAEVSITYMNVEAANALIEWACKLPNGK